MILVRFSREWLYLYFYDHLFVCAARAKIVYLIRAAPYLLLRLLAVCLCGYGRDAVAGVMTIARIARAAGCVWRSRRPQRCFGGVLCDVVSASAEGCAAGSHSRLQWRAPPEKENGGKSIREREPSRLYALRLIGSSKV